MPKSSWWIFQLLLCKIASCSFNFFWQHGSHARKKLNISHKINCHFFTPKTHYFTIKIYLNWWRQFKKHLEILKFEMRWLLICYFNFFSWKKYPDVGFEEICSEKWTAACNRSDSSAVNYFHYSTLTYENYTFCLPNWLKPL